MKGEGLTFAVIAGSRVGIGKDMVYVDSLLLIFFFFCVQFNLRDDANRAREAEKTDPHFISHQRDSLVGE